MNLVQRIGLQPGIIHGQRHQPSPNPGVPERAAGTGRSRLVAAVVHAALLLAGVATESASAQLNTRTIVQPKRSILLIVADDVGIDKIEPYVHYYNNNARTDDNVGGVGTVPCTPTIRALSESGVMFMNAWACATCSPTRASMLTGTHPFRHGVYSPTNSETFSAGPAGGHAPTTIAQVLGAAGYETAIFGKWHLGENANHGPVDNGWDLHQGYLAGEIEDYYAWTKTESDSSGDSSAKLSGYTEDYAPTVNAADAADWINARTGNWMATVAFNAAHWVLQDIDGDGVEDQTFKYQVPPSGCGCHTATSTDEDQIFRATVECMDAKIAELLAAISASKLEKTTIIFLGDNGTEDARSDHFATGRGKGNLYEGGINVPMVVADGYSYLHGGAQSPVLSGTGRIVSPRRISTALVQAVDLYATIADIAGADKSCGVDAVTLIPLLNNSAASVRDTSFAQTSASAWAVRSTDYKLIEKADAVCGTSRQLFDLAHDRWEQTNLLCDGTSAFESYIIMQLTARKVAILTVPDCYP